MMRGFEFNAISLFGMMGYPLNNSVHLEGSDFRAVDGNLAFASNQERNSCLNEISEPAISTPNLYVSTSVKQKLFQAFNWYLEFKEMNHKGVLPTYNVNKLSPLFSVLIDWLSDWLVINRWRS